MAEHGFIHLIAGADWVVKGVLAILLFFSVYSWAIIFFKWSFLRKVERENAVFRKKFRRVKNLEGVAGKLGLSPTARLYTAMASEPAGTGRDEFRHVARRLVGLEASRLERYLNFLATTGSSTPFIGLFGTVWGIMNAFRGIGSRGSASLAVVAPGIAEALVATAAGLAAAIPAVIAYNYYLSRVRRISVEMEDFSQELVDFFTHGADGD